MISHLLLFTYACKSVGGLFYVWKSFGAVLIIGNVSSCRRYVFQISTNLVYWLFTIFIVCMFFYIFSFANGINFIILLLVSNQMDENVASNRGLGRFYLFGDTDNLYVRSLSLIVWFAKIALRSIKDCGFVLICQCITQFQRLSAFQNSYGKNRPLIIVSWANLTASCLYVIAYAQWRNSFMIYNEFVATSITFRKGCALDNGQNGDVASGDVTWTRLRGAAKKRYSWMACRISTTG